MSKRYNPIDEVSEKLND